MKRPPDWAKLEKAGLIPPGSKTILLSLHSCSHDERSSMIAAVCHFYIAEVGQWLLAWLVVGGGRFGDYD